MSPPVVEGPVRRLAAPLEPAAPVAMRTQREFEAEARLSAAAPPIILAAFMKFVAPAQRPSKA